MSDQELIEQLESKSINSN